MHGADRRHSYRCPNVPPVDLDGFAAFAIDESDFGWCNYIDCRGCTTQRRLRVADLPDPTNYFDARDPEDREVDASFADPFDGAFDWGRSAP